MASLARQSADPRIWMSIGKTDPGAPMPTVATSFGIPWTAAAAEAAFTSSNAIGLTAASFLLASAIKDLKKNPKDLNVSNVVFPCLFVVDLMVRYYIVIAATMVYPWLKAWTALFVVLFVAILLTWLIGTRKTADMYSGTA